MTKYEEVLKQVETLSATEKTRLVSEVLRQIEAAEEKPLSIMLLQGLGKEIWRGIDTDEYLRQERESWDG